LRRRALLPPDRGWLESCPNGRAAIANQISAQGIWLASGAQLKKPDDINYFSGKEKRVLRQKLQQAELPFDQTNSLEITGRAHPLLAVFDINTPKIVKFIRTD
jgi:hypothetical protein